MSENLGGAGSLALFGGFDGFGSGAVVFFENYGVLRVPPPYFEGARFISEVFSSWFRDMFEKIWILLKFWPFSAASATVVTGAKIAISTSPAPLFVGFWWVRHPPPYFGGGESIFEGVGVLSDGMLRLFPPFFSLLHVLGA